MTPNSMINSSLTDDTIAYHTKEWDNKGDLGAVYVEIMATCQHFYELPTKESNEQFYISPRLEDSVLIRERSCAQENPQDPMAASPCVTSRRNQSKRQLQ